jgi:NADPH:quinone reductase-like Zn-dependent oxidoreductase
MAVRDITGINLGNNPAAETLSTLAEMAAAGQLRVRIDAEVTLADVPATIARTRTGHAARKTIIII